MAVKGTNIVLKKADNGHDIKLSPGEKTLIVERGDFKFETDKLILRKGETITVTVTLVNGQVEVRQGDNLIGQGELPAVAVAEPRGPATDLEPQDRQPAESTTAGQGAPSEGWIPLFNGNDRTGWYEPPENQGTWRVVDGVLIGQGGGPFGSNAHLVTVRDGLKDFKLRLEVVGAHVGMSGVLLRSPARAIPSELSIGGEGYRIALTTGMALTNEQVNAGAIHDVLDENWGPRGSAKSIDLPPESYMVEIHVSGRRITTFVEGEKAAEYEDDENRYSSGQIRLISRYDSEFGLRRIELALPNEQPPSAEAAPDQEATKLQEFIENPTFAEGLTGWNQEEGTAGFRSFRWPDGQPALSTWGRADKNTGRVYQQFRVPQNAKELTFDVHGGNSPALYVGLKHGQKTIFRATGDKSNTPKQVKWNVQELRGKPVTLEVVDEATGAWGFIGVQSFQIVVDDPAPN